MIQTTYSADQLQTMHNHGIRYLVVAKRAIGRHQLGQVLSEHKLHGHARTAAKPHQHAGIYELAEVLQDAKARGL